MRSILTIKEELDLIVAKERRKEKWRKFFDFVIDVALYLFVVAVAYYSVMSVVT